MNAPYHEHQRVVLTRDIPADGLRCGDVGTVVGIYGNGGGYEVEFTDADGSTVVVATLGDSDIRA